MNQTHLSPVPKYPSSFAPASLATVSFMSTVTLLYFLTAGVSRNPPIARKVSRPRSTTLPGFGILGDRINEFLEIFLDALAIYVHNDSKWDCQRRLLCEANRRAADYGIIHGIFMYLASLSVSFWLRGQKVSESMEAMKKGRQGLDCVSTYPQCPFSL
ncbi:unnamed protein product [Allacma fusca]|uniref:Uncharacterized protein n=1 Tax=Allacma fusca TaxID=39272 RepID=A0A8J2NU76_9HEXA|nr:unnamed protein product [Allacma fusca]